VICPRRRQGVAHRRGTQRAGVAFSRRCLVDAFQTLLRIDGPQVLNEVGVEAVVVEGEVVDGDGVEGDVQKCARTAAWLFNVRCVSASTSAVPISNF